MLEITIQNRTSRFEVKCDCRVLNNNMSSPYLSLPGVSGKCPELLVHQNLEVSFERDTGQSNSSKDEDDKRKPPNKRY